MLYGGMMLTRVVTLVVGRGERARGSYVTCLLFVGTARARGGTAALRWAAACTKRNGRECGGSEANECTAINVSHSVLLCL